MDRTTAERLMTAVLALDASLGEIDAAISQITDQAERQAFANTLGEMLRLQNDDFIRTVSVKNPDLAPQDGLPAMDDS
jgi:hypothetical protein